jgi:hypothetical protein
MMGISVILLVAMPKMMEGLGMEHYLYFKLFFANLDALTFELKSCETDPEALKEMRESQPQNSLEMPDISGALANFMTGKT